MADRDVGSPSGAALHRKDAQCPKDELDEGVQVVLYLFEESVAHWFVRGSIPSCVYDATANDRYSRLIASRTPLSFRLVCILSLAACAVRRRDSRSFFFAARSGDHRLTQRSMWVR